LLQTLGQEKIKECRQLGWRLLAPVKGLQEPQPPGNYFRYHNVPQFEVLISGLLGVPVIYVKGKNGQLPTLRAAAPPASGLPVPVWGNEGWVLGEWQVPAAGSVLV
jgi:hypothetical protein